MPGASSAALVGATGGAGTTRTTIELAATLARDGRSVAILDAAFNTQGLAHCVPGRLDPDLTALLTDRADAPLDAGLVDLDRPPGHGRVACCPAYAPFERLARAKTVAAAERFEARIREATTDFDHVLVDTPPVAANQAVAAANAADRVVAVAPGTDRGADALQRLRERLQDVQADVDAVLATCGDLAAADATLPETAPTALAEAPVPSGRDPAFDAAAIRAAEVVVDSTLALDPPQPGAGRYLDRLREHI